MIDFGKKMKVLLLTFAVLCTIAISVVKGQPGPRPRPVMPTILI